MELDMYTQATPDEWRRWIDLQEQSRLMGQRGDPEQAAQLMEKARDIEKKVEREVRELLAAAAAD